MPTFLDVGQRVGLYQLSCHLGGHKNGPGWVRQSLPRTRRKAASSGENSNEAEHPTPFLQLGSNSLEWLQTVSYYICQMLFQMEKDTEKEKLHETKEINSVLICFHSSFFPPPPFQDHISCHCPHPCTGKAQARHPGLLAFGHCSCLDRAPFILTTGGRSLRY